MIVHQDYELAEQFINIDFSFCYKEDGPLIEIDIVAKQLFYLEGIFLDLTDRTSCHPIVPYAHEDRGGKFANLVKEFGLGNRKIIWKPTDLFNIENYFEKNWFPSALEMYNQDYDEMTSAKELYSERRITFLEYFFKRLDIYRKCEMPTFIKYFRGVSIEKYKDRIRKITDSYPYINNRGEII